MEDMSKKSEVYLDVMVHLLKISKEKTINSFYVTNDINFS